MTKGEQTIFIDRDGCWLCQYMEKHPRDLGERFRWVRREYLGTVEQAMQKYPDIKIRLGTPPGLDPEANFRRIFKERRREDEIDQPRFRLIE